MSLYPSLNTGRYSLMTPYFINTLESYYYILFFESSKYFRVTCSTKQHFVQLNGEAILSSSCPSHLSHYSKLSHTQWLEKQHIFIISQFPLARSLDWVTRYPTQALTRLTQMSVGSVMSAEHCRQGVVPRESGMRFLISCWCQLWICVHVNTFYIQVISCMKRQFSFMFLCSPMSLICSLHNMAAYSFNISRKMLYFFQISQTLRAHMLISD